MEQEPKQSHYQKYKETIIKWQKNNPDKVRDVKKRYRENTKNQVSKKMVQEYMLKNYNIQIQ